MTSPLTPRQEAEDVEAFGSSRDHARAVSGGAGTPAPPIPSPTWTQDAADYSWLLIDDDDCHFRVARSYDNEGVSRWVIAWSGSSERFRACVGGTYCSEQEAKQAVEGIANIGDGVGRAPRPTVADGEESRDDHLQSSEEAQDLRRANPLEPDFRRMD